MASYMKSFEISFKKYLYIILLEGLITRYHWADSSLKLNSFFTVCCLTFITGTAGIQSALA